MQKADRLYDELIIGLIVSSVACFKAEVFGIEDGNLFNDLFIINANKSQ